MHAHYTWPRVNKPPLLRQAVPYLMRSHPRLQLVVVGPIGDAVGAAAAIKLAQLSCCYAGRMHCPLDRCVAGDEKRQLLAAADFVLCPSRCGCAQHACRDACMQPHACTRP